MAERVNTTEPFLEAATVVKVDRLKDMRKHVKKLYLSGEIDLVKAMELTLAIERLEAPS